MTWLEKAKNTHRFHCEHLAEDSRWRLSDTAKELKISIGAVSERLLIVKWLKTHKAEIEAFEHAYKALEFIRHQEIIEKFDEVD